MPQFLSRDRTILLHVAVLEADAPAAPVQAALEEAPLLYRRGSHLVAVRLVRVPDPHLHPGAARAALRRADALVVCAGPCLALDMVALGRLVCLREDLAPFLRGVRPVWIAGPQVGGAPTLPSDPCDALEALAGSCFERPRPAVRAVA